MEHLKETANATNAEGCGCYLREKWESGQVEKKLHPSHPPPSSLACIAKLSLATEGTSQTCLLPNAKNLDIAKQNHPSTCCIANLSFPTLGTNQPGVNHPPYMYACRYTIHAFLNNAQWAHRNTLTSTEGALIIAQRFPI